MDIVELTAGDRDNRYQRAALVLRTLGWLSIIWGVCISIWVMMGERAGSQLWLYWTLGQLVAGVVLLGIARHLQNRGAAMPLLEDRVIEHRDRAA
ncbi:MAG TPA: hypothetical protein VFP40_13320 [Terriglobales bacterium]|jgi:hypothetical protein|nr:hypothetical protein [Terriglobales bacterium]